MTTINLTDDEIKNFKCDVCGNSLDIYYYQNHWMEIRGVYRKCNSFDDSHKFINVICDNCWHKAFPNIGDNSKSAKTAIKRTCLDEIGELYSYDKMQYCNSKPEYCTNAKCTDATKPNPYMPYEYCGTQLKSDTVYNDFMHIPIGGIIYPEVYNIIKDKLKHGIEYHECDGTRINKKEYETLYDIIGHKYDDVGDNAEVSDFRLPNVEGWYIRIK